MISTERGVATTTVLPWVLAAFGFGSAVLIWVRTPVEGPPDLEPVTRSASEERLERALDRARADAEMLRRELDRLADLVVASGAVADPNAKAGVTHDAGDSAAATTTSPAAATATLETKHRVGDALAAAAAGDLEAARAVTEGLFELLRSGPAAFPAMVDLYLEAQDPMARAMILPTMLFTGGEAARDFLFDQIDVEPDPMLRGQLLEKASTMVNPEVSGRLEGPFVEALGMGGQPDTRLAAVRGLKHASTSRAFDALGAAVGDPDERVRLAAIDALARRPSSRARLRSLLDQGLPADVREFAECRLMVAEALP